jgi:hypothetical protein
LQANAALVAIEIFDMREGLVHTDDEWRVRSSAKLGQHYLASKFIDFFISHCHSGRILVVCGPVTSVSIHLTFYISGPYYQPHVIAAGHRVDNAGQGVFFDPNLTYCVGIAPEVAPGSPCGL